MMNVESELQAIQERNRLVEADKAWEISMMRRSVIAVITYLTAVLFLWMIDVATPLMNALVPTGGYVLSTLSLPWMKKLWINRQKK